MTINFTIFDDHEISDDWYKNRRWCKQVLSKPLGSHVIQNGLLAYALFQGWGNTPDQFVDEQPGQKLLDAASAWSQSNGTNNDRERKIAHLVGIPYDDDEAKQFLEDLKKNPQLTHEKLADDAPLRSWHGSLNWHYTVTGLNHEVIVLDTRTWRAYPKEQEDEDEKDEDDINFPQLLSQKAFQRQIADVPQASSTKVTFVVAATPVIGVPQLEKKLQALAFCSNLRYEFDTEVWKLQKIAFERLLAKLAVRGKNPVIFLSGDVHYGFAARLQYWGKQPFEEQLLPVEAQLVVAQLTSSALKNKAFVPLLCNKLTDPFEILGWKHLGKKPLQIGSKNTVVFDKSIRTIPWSVLGNPATVNLEEERGKFTKLQLKKPAEGLPPQWRYRIDFILAKFEEINEKRGLVSVEPAPVENPSERPIPLQEYLAMASNHRAYSERWGNGKEIVGVNNIGEITFEWTDAKKLVFQNLWWRLESWDSGKLLDPFPLTRYEIPLLFDEKNYPKPDVPEEVNP